jgi:hypothetical protein
MRYLKYTVTEVEFRPRRSQMRVPLQVHAFRKSRKRTKPSGKCSFSRLLSQEEAQLKALLLALSANAARWFLSIVVAALAQISKRQGGILMDRVVDPLFTLRFWRCSASPPARTGQRKC